MIVLRAVPDRLDVVVVTDCGRFRVHPDGFIDGPNLTPGAARHPISPTLYWEWFECKGDWSYCPPERFHLKQGTWLEVPENWRTDLTTIQAAASESGNFNR